MTEIKTIQEEVMLWGWGESNTAGRWLKLQLPDDGDHPLKGMRTGKNGQRFMMVLALIGEDEEKADHVFPDGYTEGSEKLPGPSRAQQSGIARKNPQFQKWLRESCPRADFVETPTEKVHSICNVNSCAEFDTDPEARKRWDNLYQKYKEDAGLMAEQH